MALGARDRANMPVRTKNFFLAKIQDSESVNDAVNHVNHAARLRAL